MRIASVAEFKSQFSSFLKASVAGPIVLTRNGKAVAVILGVQNRKKRRQKAKGRANQSRKLRRPASRLFERCGRCARPSNLSLAFGSDTPG
jgi:prevent-host-death family protein